MKMLIKQALLLSGMIMTACQSTQPQEGKKFEMDCREQEKVIKKANNQTGVVRYDNDAKVYTIMVRIPNND
ncbi:hypothetical protein BWI97_25305 [Siphonobacter sp. BAB-5405]|nr:hypothetical protein BWI97_25305 [Siphonobacter sp. BAB-5405]